MPRILTYNVHRCLGVDNILDVDRIAAVIAAQAPDIVALQEVDVGRARTGGVDQAHQLAQRLGMAFHFNAALRIEQERYGDAILTALPERLVKAGPLPGHPRFHRLEARGALWVAVMIDRVELQVINTHLGLVPAEQWRQAEALAGGAWLAAIAPSQPALLVGDFNAGRRSRAYRTIAARLTEARQTRARHRGRPAQAAPTFPSSLPMLAIDHVFASPGLIIDAVATPLDPLSRVASDHLPLVVDFHFADR